MRTILVQMADGRWTMQAVHLASAMARSMAGRVVLLYLMPVKNPGLLGSELGITPPTPQEHEEMAECASIAEDYGVEISVQPMQYESLTDALVQAAELLEPFALFACVPESIIPLWRRFQLWTLQRQLAVQHCRLYTLDQPGRPEAESVPSVHVNAIR